MSRLKQRRVNNASNSADVINLGKKISDLASEMYRYMAIQRSNNNFHFSAIQNIMETNNNLLKFIRNQQND